jgi:hypothetical protein
LKTYAASYSNQSDAFAIDSVGQITYLHGDDGSLIVECDCYNKAKNSFCALEFDNALSTFTALPHNSTAFNVNSNSDGSFDIVSSQSIEITCSNSSSLYTVNGKPLSNIACYSATFTNGTCQRPATGNNGTC